MFFSDLANDLEGVNSSLVFNVDEMGVELYADKKDVMVLSDQEKFRAMGTF